MFNLLIIHEVAQIMKDFYLNKKNNDLEKLIDLILDKFNVKYSGNNIDIILQNVAWFDFGGSENIYFDKIVNYDKQIPVQLKQKLNKQSTLSELKSR